MNGFSNVYEWHLLNSLSLSNHIEEKLSNFRAE